MSTTLDALAGVLPTAQVRGDGATLIDDLAYDSRAVTPGSLYFCIPGARADGHDFASAAMAAGAVALVVERPLDVDAPQVQVPSVRDAMPRIASTFFGDPSRAMDVIGVTGTNGKTTSVFLLDAVARARGVRPGLMGTIETRIGDAVEPVKHTTPESVDLQRLLARMRAAGVDQVSMEVSSHGLAYRRVAGTRYACAAFTNLTQDHLDDHGTMEAYFEAKALLFTEEYTARAAINVGDEYGARLRERLTMDVVTFAADAPADVTARDVTMDGTGSRAIASTPSGDMPLHVRLPGPYNVTNALGVLAIGIAMGWDLEVVARGIASLDGTPGRVERIDAGQPFTVLVDYAHTPDALDNVLRAARTITPEGARLVAVFGCGGDRDRGKRPLMGRVATSRADHTIITSDNPRTEEPAAIVDEIAAGADGSFETIVDRRDAIEAALTRAAPGDVVVIAGKGHETGQTFADRTIPFDDRLVAREILEGLA